MALFTGTTHTYLRNVAGNSNIREDLSNVIYNIDPEETPFISNVGKESVNSVNYEWLTDSLASAVTDNAVLDGDEITFTTTAARNRMSNYTQISRKQVIVSGTLRAVNTAGVDDELAYQIAKMGKELRLDMEARAISQYPANAGAAGTARQTAGFECFIRTNAQNSTTGASNPTYSGGNEQGYPQTAPVDGTARSFVTTAGEALLKSAIQAAWTKGGKPHLVIMSPAKKALASAFAGIAQLRKEVPGARAATVVASVDVYVSDFGDLHFVPSRHQRDAAVLLVDPSYAGICTLRDFEMIDLAKTGDADKKAILVEWGVKVHNEKAHSVIRALS
jgi:hypothetical protein